MKKFWFLIFALSLPFNPLFSSAHDDEEMVSEFVSKILSYAPNTIEKIIEDRIFLKSEYLSIVNSRIILEDPSGYVLELPSISSTSEGIFVLTGLYLVYECTKCHEQYGWHPVVCDRCGNTLFIRKYVSISKNSARYLGFE